jgi:hypothetical protein
VTSGDDGPTRFLGRLCEAYAIRHPGSGHADLACGLRARRRVAQPGWFVLDPARRDLSKPELTAHFGDAAARPTNRDRTYPLEVAAVPVAPS